MVIEVFYGLFKQFGPFSDQLVDNFSQISNEIPLSKALKVINPDHFSVNSVSFWQISTHFNQFQVYLTFWLQSHFFDLKSTFQKVQNLDLKSIRHNSDPQKRVQGPFRSIHVKFEPIWFSNRLQKALVDFLVNWATSRILGNFKSHPNSKIWAFVDQLGHISSQLQQNLVI